MENSFKKHMSHYKFIDYLKQSPTKMDVSSYQKHSNRASSKHKSDKIYTQVSSSSRATNKISASTHQSPTKPKQEKLLKTSVLNYLHKCRSEYEETATNLTLHKSTKNIKSIKSVDQEQKTIKCTGKQSGNKSQLLQRTSELLDMYKNRCSWLQLQKSSYKWLMEQAHTTIKQLQKSIKKYKKQQKSQQKDK